MKYGIIHSSYFEEVPLKAFVIVAVTYCLRLAFSTAPAPVGTPRVAYCTTSRWIWGISKETPQPLGCLCQYSITMQHESVPGAQTKPVIFQFVLILALGTNQKNLAPFYFRSPYWYLQTPFEPPVLQAEPSSLSLSS